MKTKRIKSKLEIELFDLVADEIMRYTDNRNMKQAEIAKILGVSQPRASTFFNRKYELFETNTVLKFAEAFKIKINFKLSACKL